jgi:hypothetical protein
MVQPLCATGIDRLAFPGRLAPCVTGDNDKEFGFSANQGVLEKAAVYGQTKRLIPKLLGF